MVDRLEELLAMMADEDDEEQEDALAPEAERMIPAAPAPGDGGEPERQPDPEVPEGAGREERVPVPAPAETGTLWAAPLRTGGEQPPGDGRPATAHDENGLTEIPAPRTGNGREAERGLEELYRRTAQAARPTARSLPAEQAGRTIRTEEPGRAAALTVDELDRAVKRDSRRYDGGITIY